MVTEFMFVNINRRMYPGADPEPALPGGGAQVTNEAEAVGEGSPLPQVGVHFEKFASKWCILNAF